MASRTKRKKAGADQPVEGHPHVLAHFILGCVGLLAVAYGAALLLSRTDGMRYLVGDRLEQQLGLPVRIGAMRLTPGLDLVLENVTTDDARTIQVERLEISGSLLQKLKGRPWLQSAEITGCRLAMTQSPGGRWSPAACMPMSEWLVRWCGIRIPSLPLTGAPGQAKDSAPGEKTLDAADLGVNESRGFHHQIPLKLRNGKIIWQDAQGGELASAGDIEVHITPLRTQTREMQHAVFSAGHVRSAAGDYITGIFVELLSTQGHHVLLAQRANRTRSDTPPSGAYQQAYEYGVPDYLPDAPRGEPAP